MSNHQKNEKQSKHYCQMHSNISDHTSKTRKQRSIIEKPNRTRETACKLPLLRQSYGFPLGGGDRYANKFTLAVNFNCTLHMRQTLHEVLNHGATGTRVIKRLYGKTDISTGKPKNHFGTYTTMEFADMTKFYDYGDQYSSLVPDGMMKMNGVSTFANQKRGNNTIISVSFTYTGTMIQQHADIQVSSDVYHDSNTTSNTSKEVKDKKNKHNCFELDEEEPVSELNRLSDSSTGGELQESSLSALVANENDVNRIEFIEFDPMETASSSIAVFSAYPIEAAGSYTLYINEENKIDCIEFIYAFQ